MRKIFILITLCTSVAVMATEGALSGRFTINANGDQVVFSQGNLQYVGTWQFAEHQWDYFGNSQYDNHRDLFGWGTGDAPNKVSKDDNDYSTFVDWGTNAIVNGGNQKGQWRTLSMDEWGYIMRVQATVCGVHGCVLLPDDFTLPDGLTLNDEINDWDTNNYNAQAWSSMEGG